MIDLTELKESLRLLYATVGPEIPAIGMIGLKLVDVIEDICEERDPTEDLQHISRFAHHTVLAAMIDRATMLDLPGTVNDIKLAISVQGTWREKKLVYLKAIANAYRALAEKTGCEYPKVVTADGTVL